MKEQNFKQTEIGKIPVDWKVKNFLDVFTFLNTANYSRAEVSENETTGYIHYGDIHTKFDFHLDLSKQISGFISKEKQKSYSKIEIGDLIMADASEDYAGVGKSVEVIKLNNKNAISGLHTFLIRDKNKNFALGFKGYLHSNPLIKKQYDSLATGLKVFSLSKGCFQNIQIPLPPLAEQEKIAEVLSDTDLWIESTEALLAKKRQIKKGAMQKLLSPKEDWEVRKFNEVFKRIPAKKYQLNSNQYFEDGKYPIIDQGKSKFVGFSDNYDKVFYSSGAIIFGDHTRIIKYYDSNFIVGADGVQILQSEQNLKFLYYLLQTKEIPNTGYNRHFKFVLELEFEIPPLKTQQEIAEILSAMDLEIESLENRLQKARNIKQGMMQDLLTGKVRLV